MFSKSKLESLGKRWGLDRFRLLQLSKLESLRSHSFKLSIYWKVTGVMGISLPGYQQTLNIMCQISLDCRETRLGEWVSFNNKFVLLEGIGTGWKSLRSFRNLKMILSSNFLSDVERQYLHGKCDEEYHKSRWKIIATWIFTFCQLWESIKDVSESGILDFLSWQKHPSLNQVDLIVPKRGHKSEDDYETVTTTGYHYNCPVSCQVYVYK